MGCGRFYGPDFIRESAEAADGIPYCKECGAVVKPDVVLYEEGLDSKTVAGAVDALASADMLIIGGTSLAVYPAAGLINYFSGKYIVLINKSATAADTRADIILRESIGSALGTLRI